MFLIAMDVPTPRYAVRGGSGGSCERRCFACSAVVLKRSVSQLSVFLTLSCRERTMND